MSSQEQMGAYMLVGATNLQAVCFVVLMAHELQKEDGDSYLTWVSLGVGLLFLMMGVGFAFVMDNLAESPEEKEDRCELVANEVAIQHTNDIAVAVHQEEGKMAGGLGRTKGPGSFAMGAGIGAVGGAAAMGVYDDEYGQQEEPVLYDDGMGGLVTEEEAMMLAEEQAYAATNPTDPYAMQDYAAEQRAADPYADPYAANDPYAQDPYGQDPYSEQMLALEDGEYDEYADPYGDPYGTPQTDYGRRTLSPADYGQERY